MRGPEASPFRQGFPCFFTEDASDIIPVSWPVRASGRACFVFFNCHRQAVSPLPTKGAKVRRFQWVSVALLVLVGIVNILDRSTLAIANHNVSEDLHLSPTE